MATLSLLDTVFRRLLITVNYGAPLATALAFFAVYIALQNGSTKKPSHHPPVERLRVVAFLSSGVAITLLGQAVLHIFKATRSADRGSIDGTIVFALLQGLVWITMSLLLQGDANPPWPAHVAAWLVSIMADATILASSIVTDEARGPFGSVSCCD